jgi:hypothetical protein
MSQYFTSVKVLHCGGEDDFAFIKLLENAVKGTSSPPAFHLDYTRHHDNQSRDITILRDVHRFKKEKSPLIVLVSMTFFDLIWKTPNKTSIVNAISSYSSRNCVHIWINVQERDVHQRSKALIRNDGSFRSVKAQDLQMLPADDMVKKMLDLLQSPGKSSSMNNCAVDDDTEGMYQRYKHYISCTEEEQREMYRHHIHPPYYNNNNNTYAPKTKTKYTSPPQRLMDVNEKHINQIATSLSKGPGANWKQLAQAFGFDSGAIEALVESHSLEVARSKGFVDLLRNSRGEMDVEELARKCRQILRTDVAAYISEHVLGGR